MKNALLAIAVVILLSGCTSSEQRAADEAAEKARVAQQMWEADGHPGPMPDLSAAAVAEGVADVAVLTDDIIMNGSSDQACADLEEKWDDLHLAEFDNDDQQATLEALTDSLSQAISGCQDGRWQDAMDDVLDANAIAYRYDDEFTR